MVVLTNPVTGREDEYNDWYTNIHLSDVLKVAGFTAAQRFKLSEAKVMGDTPYQYMAIYEIDAEDPQPAIDALTRAAKDGMIISNALDTKKTVACVFSPITERVMKEA
jgi:hypothetical protein